jgi:hypothetical protein
VGQGREPQQQPQPTGDEAPDQTEPSSSTTQQRPRRDWIQISTLVAALAAAGGLVFSGWTGYYSVRTAQDQLDQSRADADRELRQQAVLVSTWTQADGSNALRGEPGGVTGFITNRSLDPVDQVLVGIATQKGGDPVTTQTNRPKILLYLGLLPPCSRVTISAAAAKRALASRTDREYVISGVSFVDVYGQRWARVSSGPLEPLAEASDESRDPFMDNHQSILKVLTGSKELPTVWTIPGAGASILGAPKPLEDCGAEK